MSHRPRYRGAVKITTRPAPYGRLSFSRQEFRRLHAAWSNVERPAPLAPFTRDDDPRPAGPAAARPASALRHHLWPEAA